MLETLLGVHVQQGQGKMREARVDAQDESSPRLRFRWLLGQLGLLGLGWGYALLHFSVFHHWPRR